jgi:hypothetical protein
MKFLISHQQEARLRSLRIQPGFPRRVRSQRALPFISVSLAALATNKHLTTSSLNTIRGPKFGSSLSSTCPVLRVSLLCGWLLAAGGSGPVLGQVNYSPPYTFTTLAGQAGNSGYKDGTNSTARFNLPADVSVDGEGCVYVVEVGNHTIRRLTPQGVVSTLAGQAGRPGSADGTNNAARFNGPSGVAVDAAGIVYVGDTFNHTIRKLARVGTNWVVTTLAGQAGRPGSADGTNQTARFNTPCGVRVDSAGSLYVADNGNCTIRKITPVDTNWVVTTLAGQAGRPGSADGTNSAARFGLYMGGLAVDSATNVYVADYDNHTIRKLTLVETNWIVTTLAGAAGTSGSANGTGRAARFYCPNDVRVDSAGNLYVADQFGEMIRKMTLVETNWVVTTLAGVAGTPGSANGTGSTAKFNAPCAVVLDSADNLYVVDCYNHTIRKGMPTSSVQRSLSQVASLSPSGFSIGFSGPPGLELSLESSSDLSQWQWLRTFSLVAGTNYYDLPAPLTGNRFYRLKIR